MIAETSPFILKAETIRSGVSCILLRQIMIPHPVPSEITWLLKTLGFSKIEIFGAKLGAFSRDDELTTEDYEMLVVAER